MFEKSLYCIGQDGYTLEEFNIILKKHNISILVDIRVDPNLEFNQAFSQTVLREKLAEGDIVYHWAGRQFGERQEASSDSKHTRLPKGLMAFADYMQGPEFPRAVMQLVNLSTKGKTALMCSEARANLSHCDLIVDYLLLQGIQVNNIHTDGNMVEHILSATARRESAELIYDRNVKE